ncbi:MAG TPA: hypothetical protein VJZ25_05330 [Gemmatimonadaceae bacterium]|nr:hypothetical protein [Gemmatimonadaceae bacterium]
MRQTAVTIIGAALVAVGCALALHLVSVGWSWGLGILAVFLIVEGLDCLYAGITGREGATPALFLLWPWP